MRYFLLALGLLFLVGGPVGCKATGDEEHDFFYSGWRNPQEGSNQRMYGSKVEPEDYGGHASQGTDFAPGPLPEH